MAWLGLGLACASAALAAPAANEPLRPLPLATAEPPAWVQLGARLFADPRLSHDQRQSCASCHPLASAGVDHRARARPSAGRPHARLRNTPTVFNVAFDPFLNWDGKTETLEAHDDAALQNPNLMDGRWPEILGRLARDPAYVAQFRRLTGGPVSRAGVLRAIVSFERSLITPNSRFDRFLRGETTALDVRERSGYDIFLSYGCTACHQGINIGGNLLQRFGVFAMPHASAESGPPDPGRCAFTGRPRDCGVFRVPSLRNVAVTGPYFHDGRAATLEVAVQEMARVQLGRDLQAEQIQALVSFLGTLTGEYQGRRLTAGPETAR